ncbi:putative tectonin beta-propeller repeat-containing protein 1 [Apostichopus japonicus]|uniref:Putative tectonin beta-propeller repeat-containing protein 1 n=1 Tax=Stichopus japonicus TaxID=307972 RepID=A0A2G8JZE3_STIJA|nr:putative tectonin beta-propeller repeat-containing protein 1 [Apostichopus japonicus]
MQEGFLWAIDCLGKAHTISTSEQFWQLRSHDFQRRPLEFKRITAGKHSAWGLSSDLFLYVYVYASDVPIRYLEFTYENQRWRPIHGFSEKALFFTDPPPFSDEKGARKLPRPREIKLPNEHWQWESEWRFESNFKGETAGGEEEMDQIPKVYGNRGLGKGARGVPKSLGSTPDRRRCWGYALPAQPAGYMSMWVVTSNGKIFCRVGINHKHPEGLGWREVSLPPKVAILQVSVSPTGIVWAVTHEGTGLVRTQVSREYPLGLGWEVVDPPERQLLSQVSMGMNAVWGRTKDGTVWIRKGFDLMLSITDRSALTGSHWIQMPGRMSHLTIGPNDQVWAISFEDHRLFMRGAVTYEELSGRSWKLINVTEKRSTLAGSQDTLNFTDTHSISSSDIFSPQSSYSLNFPFSPGYMSQTSSYPSLLSPMKLPGDRDISAESTFRSGDRQFRHLACQTEDMDPSDSVSSGDALSMGRLCDILLSDDCTGGASWRRHSLADVPRTERCGESSGSSGESTEEEEVPTELAAEAAGQVDQHIKSYATLQRQVSWTSDYSDEIVNFADTDSSDDSDSEEGHSCATFQSKETQTDLLNTCGDNESNLFYSRENSIDRCRSIEVDKPLSFEVDESSELQDHSSDTSESTDINLPDDAIFDHFERDTLKRQPSNSFSGASRHNGSFCVPPRDTKSFSDLLAAPMGSINNSSKNTSMVSFASEHYVLVEKDWGDMSYRRGTFDDDDDDDDDANMLWVWVCGGSCWVKPTSLPKWFKQGVISQASFKHKLQEGAWRGQLLKSLKARRSLETDEFSHYLSSVDTTPWIKKGKIQWQSEDRKRHWLDCDVELVKGDDQTKNKFTVVCDMYGKKKKLQIPISEVTCVFEVSTGDKPTFSILTAKSILDKNPVRFRVGTEEELRDWIVAISLACSDIQDVAATPSPYAAWCTTSRGDVFYHQTKPDTELSPAKQMYWQQIGGHLHHIESCPAGVVWGIGMDHAVWVWTGGYGGGIFKGVNSSTSGIYDQTDTKKVYLFENQRWSPLYGFSRKHILWMTDSGKVTESKDTVTPPSGQWHWTSEWQIDFSVKGSTDKEGWQFARDFKHSKGFHKEKRWNDYVRRRRWFRSCQLVTTGPWRRAKGLDLIDVSLQVDADISQDGPIAVWALGTNGDVMTRIGVTRHNPRGSSWFHIPTDQPFQSISVGGKYRVWGIGKDGSAFFRNGVHVDNVTGNGWFHVSAPGIAPLKQISVGATAVWAVDTRKNLWYRQDVTPNFPEGTRWILVSPKVRRVSVGPQDQVWILAYSVDDAKGVICRRDGITESDPQGKQWNEGAGRTLDIRIGESSVIDDDIVLGNWTEVGIVQIKLESHNVMVLNVISFAP